MIRRLLGIASGPWLAVCFLALFLAPVAGRCETLKVGLPDQVLYPDPDFASAPLCRVPLGGEVKNLLTVGDWFKVTFKDCKGWINRLAFPGLKTPSGNLPGLLSGKGVTASSRDEAALGVKGERMPPQGPPRLEDTRPAVIKAQPLYRDPDTAGTPLGSVPSGTKVTVVAEAGDWCKIKSGDQRGWLPKEALKFP